MSGRRFPTPTVFAAAAFLIPLTAYFLTLAPSVFWLDSGIYLAAARELGVAYPPGFPLYVLLAHVCGAIPVGEFAERVHALSAFAGAGTCLVIHLSIVRLGSGPGQQDDDASMCIHAAAAVAALGAGFAFALWSQAVNSEVYALQALITVLVIHFLIRCEEDPGRNLAPAAFFAGLGFANHPMIVGIIPALGLAAVSHRREIARRRWVIAVFLLAGLVPYAYIPFSSARNPLTDWGNPESAVNFLRLVTASHWTAETRSFSLFGADFWGRTAEAARLTFLQFWPPALALAVAGALRLRTTSPIALRYMAITAACAILIPLFYTQTKEFESWFIPAYLALAVFAGTGATDILRRARSRWIPAAVAMALLWPGLLLFTAVPAVDRSGDREAEEYGINMLVGVERNGILLTSGDNPSSVLLFCQAVLGARPDVVVVNQEALQSDWYRTHVRNNLRLSLPEPGPGLRDPVRVVSVLVAGLMRENQDRPVYALMPRRLILPEGVRATASGMVYLLSPNPRPAPAARWDFSFRSRPAPADSLPQDQRAKINEARIEMRAGYLRAFLSGGHSFFERGDFPVALDLYERATAISPNNEDSWLWRGITCMQMGRTRAALDVLEQLVRRMPESFRGHYNMGNVLADLGRTSEARRAYRRALSINPEMSIARDALRAL